MTSHRVRARVFFTLVCFLLAAVPALAGDDRRPIDWKPVDPAHLALKAPVVEPDADAEAIFWDVQVDFSPGKTVFANYVRIKIFTERGKELRSKIELLYSSKNNRGHRRTHHQSRRHDSRAEERSHLRQHAC